MSSKERVEWTRRILEKAEADFSNWDLHERPMAFVVGEGWIWRAPGLLEPIDDPQHQEAAIVVFRATVRKLVTDPDAEKVFAKIGDPSRGGIGIMPASARNPDAPEKAIRSLVQAFAFAMADPTCGRMITAKENVETREVVEKTLEAAKAAGDRRVEIGARVFLAQQAPLNDPIVMRRAGGRLQKDYEPVLVRNKQGERNFASGAPEKET
jgi:hypothetical protein